MRAKRSLKPFQVRYEVKLFVLDVTPAQAGAQDFLDRSVYPERIANCAGTGSGISRPDPALESTSSTS